MEITFVAFPFLFSFCARWPEGRLSPDVSRWFVSERASSLLAADPQPLLLIPTRSVRILRLNPFCSFSSLSRFALWSSHRKVPLTQRHKEWSLYLKSEETFVPFWSYDTAPVPEEERKINKLSASGPARAYWGKKEQTVSELSVWSTSCRVCLFNVSQIAHIWACELFILKVPF